MTDTKQERQLASLKIFGSAASIRSLAKAQDLSYHDLSKIGARLLSVSDEIKEDQEKISEAKIEKRNKIEKLLKMAEEQGISLGDLTEEFSQEKAKPDKKVKPKYEFSFTLGGSKKKQTAAMVGKLNPDTDLALYIVEKKKENSNFKRKDIEHTEI